jgi:ribosomal protein L32
MIKKKKSCKRGKWSAEYKVKVSVKPVKRKKKGGFAKKKKADFPKTIKCENCGKRFKPNHFKFKYCSYTCRGLKEI